MTRATRTTQESASNSCMNRKPTAVRASSFATLNDGVRSREVEQDCQDDERRTDRQEASRGRRGQREPRNREGERQEEQRHDQDVWPHADVGQHSGPRVPGDEQSDDGGERSGSPGAQ